MASRWFRISYAENALRRFATERGVTIDTLHAPTAVALSIAFYRAMRAQHALVGHEGDGLLWQWGPDADAERFTVALTRQLVREDAEPITQLRLTLAYRWTPLRRAAGRGHEWCFSPALAEPFGRSIRASAGFRAIASASPLGVALQTSVL